MDLGVMAAALVTILLPVISGMRLSKIRWVVHSFVVQLQPHLTTTITKLDKTDMVIVTLILVSLQFMKIHINPYMLYHKILLLCRIIQ